MIHDFVISNVGNKQKFRSIIDFGAGTGWMAKRLADLNIGQVIAVDHSIDAMKYIPRISDKIKISSLSDFFGSDKKFDYLVSVDTFEHLNDPIGMLQQLHSKAANGGIIFLSVPNFCSFFSKVYFGCHPYYEYPAHLNYFSIQSLSYAVEKAGFKVLAAKTITFPFEQEYIAKNYPRTMVFETGKELKRKLSVEGNGERLFLVAKKF